MSKAIPSPVGRWPGTVTLPDYFNFQQYIAWRDAAFAARQVLSREKPADAGPETVWKYDPDEYRHVFLAGVVGVVEHWDLQGITDPTPDTFPFSPDPDCWQLFDWLVKEIGALAKGVSGDDPKSVLPSSVG